MKYLTAKLLTLSVMGVFALLIVQNSFSIELFEQKKGPDTEIRAEFPITVPVIDIKTAYQLWNGHKAFFLDARHDRKYMFDHIPGAVNLPAKHITRDWRLLNDTLRNDIVVTYSDSSDALLADNLAEVLLAKGFTQVYVFKGGLDEWKANSFPIDKGWGTREARKGATEEEKAVPAIVPQIDSVTAFQLWRGDKAFFVNASSTAAHKKNRIPGSMNLPINNTEKYWFRVKDLLKDDIIVTYGSGPSDQGSENLARLLVDKGYTQVYEYKGGIKEWKDNLYPIGKKGEALKAHRPKELIRLVQPEKKGNTFLDKLGLASLNIVTSPVEVPMKAQQKADETKSGFGAVQGTGEGVWAMLVRLAGSGWNIISSPAALLHPDTKRMVEPPTVFEYDKMTYRPSLSK